MLREQQLSDQRPTLTTGRVLMPFLIPISDTQWPRSKVKTPRRNWLLLQIIIPQPRTKSGSLSSTLTLHGHVFGEGEGTSEGPGPSWPGGMERGEGGGERLKARLTTRGKRGEAERTGTQHCTRKDG
jgi:hypothetical protein